MTLFDMCQCCLDITEETKFDIWTYSCVKIDVFTRSNIPEEYRTAKIHEYTSCHNEADNVTQVTVILEKD